MRTLCLSFDMNVSSSHDAEYRLASWYRILSSQRLSHNINYGLDLLQISRFARILGTYRINIVVYSKVILFQAVYSLGLAHCNVGTVYAMVPQKNVVFKVKTNL